jgi:ferric enterobactin receptor
MKVFIIRLAFLLLFIIPAHAQNNFTISGLVKDRRTDQPLSYGSVTLFKSQDSAVVAGVLTSEKGYFQFDQVAAGRYYIQVQYIGYKRILLAVPAVSSGQEWVDLRNIALDPDPRTLDAVNVSTARQIVETRTDRQVYRADKFLNSQGGTAIDVLKNTPSVTVNSEGAITLRGSSGFLVLINGRAVATDAASILSQMPANTIENIEVITSPSVKFDPDGKGGIINIITKTGTPGNRSFSSAVQGGFPAVYRYGNLHNPVRFGADAAFNLRVEKWDFNVSASYLRNDIAGRRTGDVNTTIGNIFTSFPSDGERSFIRRSYTIRSAISYMPNSRDVFSAGFYSGYRFQSRRADIVYNNTKTDLSTGANTGRITYFNSNVARKSGSIILGNLDYAHTFLNRSVLSLSGLAESASMNGLTTNLNLAEPGRNTVLQSSRNPGENPLNAFRFKAEYALNLGKGKLETGYQYRNQIQRGDFQYLNLDLKSGNFIIIPEFSSKTRVVNHIHSVYGQYSARIEKFQYNGGLRYEYATRAFTAGSQPTRNLNLSNLFPSLRLGYQLTKTLRFTGGYSKRVQRSTNNELNPFPEREHSETLESGDPDIRPEFIDLTELGAVKDFDKGTAFVTVYNQRIKNVVNRVNSVYNDTILNRIYTNAGLATSSGLEAGTSLNIAKWWQFYAGGNLYHYHIKGSLFKNDVPVNTSSVVYSVNANTTFRFSSTLQAQLTLNYLSKKVTAQGVDSRLISPGASVKKTFSKGRLTAALQWQNADLDLFGSNRQRITTWGKNFYTTTNYIQETDIFLLNLSYNLNQTSKKSKLPSSEFGEKEF